MKKKANIILIDLDGTLIDSSERLYSLFQALVPQCNLNKKQYWKLKRAKVDHKTILAERYGFEPKEIDVFQSKWIELIENKDWLGKDKIYKGIKEHLQALSKTSSLYLLTARQKPTMVKYQMDKMELTGLFDEIFVTGGRLLKDKLVLGLSLTASDWLIGDTGHDIEAGKRLGIKTACVTNGFLSRKSLLPYKADLVIPHFTKFSIDL